MRFRDFARRSSVGALAGPWDLSANVADLGDPTPIDEIHVNDSDHAILVMFQLRWDIADGETWNGGLFLIAPTEQQWFVSGFADAAVPGAPTVSRSFSGSAVVPPGFGFRLQVGGAVTTGFSLLAFAPA